MMTTKFSKQQRIFSGSASLEFLLPRDPFTTHRFALHHERNELDFLPGQEGQRDILHSNITNSIHLPGAVQVAFLSNFVYFRARSLRDVDPSGARLAAFNFPLSRCFPLNFTIPPSFIPRFSSTKSYISSRILPSLGSRRAREELQGYYCWTFEMIFQFKVNQTCTHFFTYTFHAILFNESAFQLILPPLSESILPLYYPSARTQLGKPWPSQLPPRSR